MGESCPLSSSELTRNRPASQASGSQLLLYSCTGVQSQLLAGFSLHSGPEQTTNLISPRPGADSPKTKGTASISPSHRRIGKKKVPRTGTPPSAHCGRRSRWGARSGAAQGWTAEPAPLASSGEEENKAEWSDCGAGRPPVVQCWPAVVLPRCTAVMLRNWAAVRLPVTEQVSEAGGPFT